MVLPDTETVSGQIVDRMFRQKGLKPYVILSCFVALEIMELVNANDSFIGCVMLHDFERIKSLRLCPLSSVTIPEQPCIALIRRRGEPMASYEKEFQTTLLKTFEGSAEFAFPGQQIRSRIFRNVSFVTYLSYCIFSNMQ